MFPFDLLQNTTWNCLGEVRFGKRFSICGFLYFCALFVLSLISVIYLKSKKEEEGLSDHENNYYIFMICLLAMRSLDLFYSFYTAVIRFIPPPRRPICLMGLTLCARFLSFIGGLGIIIEGIILLVDGQPPTWEVSVPFYCNWIPLVIGYSPCTCCCLCCCYTFCDVSDDEAEERAEAARQVERERSAIRESQIIREAAARYREDRDNNYGSVNGEGVGFGAEVGVGVARPDSPPVNSRNHGHGHSGERSVTTMGKFTDFLKTLVAADDLDCPICLDKYQDSDELTQLPCQHYFHTECIRSWKNSTCPLCRQPIAASTTDRRNHSGRVENV